MTLVVDKLMTSNAFIVNKKIFFLEETIKMLIYETFRFLGIIKEIFVYSIKRRKP